MCSAVALSVLPSSQRLVPTEKPVHRVSKSTTSSVAEEGRDRGNKRPRASLAIIQAHLLAEGDVLSGAVPAGCGPKTLSRGTRSVICSWMLVPVNPGERGATREQKDPVLSDAGGQGWVFLRPCPCPCPDVPLLLRWRLAWGSQDPSAQSSPGSHRATVGPRAAERAWLGLFRIVGKTLLIASPVAQPCGQ